jgi:hypothetical protein
MFPLAKVSVRTLAQRCMQIIVLALSTLGGTAEIGSFPFFVMQPKVAKASTIVNRMSLSLAFLP